MKNIINKTAVVVCVGVVSACSDNDVVNTELAVSDNDAPPVQMQGPVAPAGTVTHFGSVTVADEQGMVSDLVGSFYKLDTGVSAEFLQSRFLASTADCQVKDDDVISFDQISTVYVPDVPGIGRHSVGAGESVILTGQAGTFATLNAQPAADTLFYDVSNMGMLGDQPVPANLVVDVSGSDQIPMIASVPVPTVESLGRVDIGEAATTVSVSTQFSWTPSSQAGSLIRIFTSTAGGFFLDDGVTVTCLVPDTGSFSFPADVRAQLGTDFLGSTPIVSRIAVNAVQVETTVFYAIRESFGDDP